MSDIGLKEFISEKFGIIEKKLDTYIDHTNNNNKSIAVMQERLDRFSDDINGIQSLNRDQHKEFYASIKELNKKIDEADLVKMKETVDYDNTRLDKNSGALKILSVIGGIFAFVITTIIALG